MKTPAATYRIQFNKDFTFEQLEAIIDYLDALGISTIYASPITGAPEDSTHGYDVTDPHSINSAIGSIETLKRIAGKLKEKGMDWLQDIVPNHMAFSSANMRLMDVLERGRLSPFHIYFDIDDQHPSSRGKVMAPFLGDELSECLRKKEIQLQLTEQGVQIAFPGDTYPLSLSAYHLLFVDMMARDTAMLMPPPLTQLAFTCLQVSDYFKWHQLKEQVFGEVYNNAAYRQQTEDLLALVNSREAWLQEVLDKQYYKLCYWKEVNRVINYRRFFTISSLIGLQMEQEQVFHDYHSYLHQLYQAGIIQGLRIDHIDGLYDPAGYVFRLRALFGEDCYIIAEKILAAKEYLPANWPLQGTSGYEFLAYVNQLYTDHDGMQVLDRFYRQLVPNRKDYKELVVRNKQLILEQYMAGELDNLVRLFFSYGLAQHDDAARWRTALSAFMVHLPVYRIYPDRYPLQEEARRILHEAFIAARSQWPAYGPELDYLQGLFTGFSAGCEQGPSIVHFLKRLMQFTGPLMAKGVEDTAFYVYNSLIAHSEVGDSPATSGISVESFHATMQHRLRTTPFSLNATATHDTKRGEDARMRLNLLARMPEVWKEAVTQWFKVNEVLRIAINGKIAPDPNEEYFIYQSVLACIPPDLSCTPAFIERLQAYMVKSLREAKVNTNWDAPHTAYEEACTHFIQRLLAADHGFLPLFRPLAKKVIEQASCYSLGQVLIKLTAPGIPDIYQGSELWNLSLVDPDNRRPIDYEKASEYLQQLQEQEKKGVGPLMQYLQDHRTAGLEKLYVTWKTLQWRRAHNDVFINGHYYPLTITGNHSVAIAYARVLGDQWVLVIALLDPDWSAEEVATQLVLPANAPTVWKNIFTGASLQTPSERHVLLRDALAGFPVALWVNAGG